MNVYISNIKLKLLLLFLSSSFVFISCIPYKTIDIQTLRPAELSLPKNFSQPVIVAGLYRGIQGLEESMAQAAIDSTAALEAVLTLSETLYHSPLFADIEIPIVVNYREDTSKTIIAYDWSIIDSIANQNNADIVISLEYMKLTPEIDSYSYWDGSLNAYYGYLTYNVYTYWRVYDTYTRKISAAHLFRDTLSWEKYDYISVKVGYQLPGFFSAASYCGYAAGIDYARMIAPSWMDENRVYFAKGSKEMRKASEFVEENEWLDAASQWQEVLKIYSSKPELCAKAAFNLALANEIMGNFDLATEWLNKSEEYYRIPEIKWYRKILDFRIRVMDKL
jgi:hypothetical protein